MAHEKTQTDIISTLEGNPRAWHKLDVRHPAGLSMREHWERIGLANDSLREVLLSEALKPEFAALLRADQHKLIISATRGQIHDVVSKDWQPHGIQAWCSMVESVIEHVRQITGAPCEVASIGTVDAGRKMFCSVEIPLGFGQGDNKTKVYLSYLASAKEGYSTVVLVDATVIVCGNTYGIAYRSGSPIRWSLTHRSSWTGKQAEDQIKQMLSDAQSGVNRRIEADELLTATPMDRTEQFGLLAVILAATETAQPSISKYIADSGIDLDAIVSRTQSNSERKLVAAVDLLATKISRGDLGPESRVYRDHVEYLVSQPGEWGDTAKRVESAITYGQTQRGHESNTTARANRHYFGSARQQAQTALDLCVAYSEQRANSALNQSLLAMGVRA